MPLLAAPRRARWRLTPVPFRVAGVRARVRARLAREWLPLAPGRVATPLEIGRACRGRPEDAVGRLRDRSARAARRRGRVRVPLARVVTPLALARDRSARAAGLAACARDRFGHAAVLAGSAPARHARVADRR